MGPTAPAAPPRLALRAELLEPPPPKTMLWLGQRSPETSYCSPLAAILSQIIFRDSQVHLSNLT